MNSRSSRLGFSRAVGRRVIPSIACALGVLCLAQTPGAIAGSGPASAAPSGAPGSRPGVSATVEQCVASGTQSERSATFVGEMTAIGGTARMQMRIDVLERGPGEVRYHTVSAPGLGVWRTAAAGVKVYKYLKQVTDLAAPAFYRGAVRFRWLNAKGEQIGATELRTPRCEQPPASAASSVPVSSAAPQAGA
jgi:hypothetical protein